VLTCLVIDRETLFDPMGNGKTRLSADASPPGSGEAERPQTQKTKKRPSSTTSTAILLAPRVEDFILEFSCDNALFRTSFHYYGFPLVAVHLEVDIGGFGRGSDV
jgi:hypothetical protein